MVSGVLGQVQAPGTRSAWAFAGRRRLGQDVATAAKKIGVSYPILMPDEKVAKQYGGVDYLPETFYIDSSGKVVDVTAGAPSRNEMEALIQKTIAAGGA